MAMKHFYRLTVDGQVGYEGDEPNAKAQYNALLESGSFNEAIELYKVYIREPKLILKAARNGVVQVKRARKPRAKKAPVEVEAD